MKTELKVVQPVIEPGRQINVVPYKVRNYQIHQVAEQLAYLALGIIESDSGNTSAQNSPRETRNFWKGYNLAKLEWENAIAFRDTPTPELEFEEKILLPHANEIKQLKNLKVRRVVQAIQHLARILVGLDSAGLKNGLGPSDIVAGGEAFAHTTKVFEQYWGTGEGNIEEGFSEGLQAPEYAFGELTPDVDLDSGRAFEPSSESPASSFEDVPDQPSTAPAPGTEAPSS